MKFLCLCYYDQARFDALSEDDRQALGGLCRPHDESLRASGRLVMVGSLGRTALVSHLAARQTARPR